MATPTETVMIPVAGIIIGDRVRKVVQHVGTLAESIKRIGLLHPVVVNSRNELIAGFRRLRAVEQCGWAEVPAHRVASLDDAVSALIAERDENTCRSDLTYAELVELGEKIEALEKPEAAKREKAGKKVQPSGKFPEGSKGDTRDKVGKALGVSGKTYEKAKRVKAAAAADPDRFGDLVAKMDAESVDAAHKELKARQRKAAAVAKLADPEPTAAEPVVNMGSAAKYRDAVLANVRLSKKKQENLSVLMASPDSREPYLNLVASYDVRLKPYDTGEQINTVLYGGVVSFGIRKFSTPALDEEIAFYAALAVLYDRMDSQPVASQAPENVPDWSQVGVDRETF